MSEELLTTKNTKENQGMEQYFFRASAADFKKIPGSPIAYWVSKGLIAAFENGIPLKKIATPRQGLATMDNARFTRLWYEVSASNASVFTNSNSCKWFPYNKAGDFRKWYGNQEAFVNWSNDGFEIKQLSISRYGSASKRVVNEDSYFLPSVTWGKISSSKPSFRYQPEGAIFDVAGMSLFPSTNDFQLLLTLLNSKLVLIVLELLSPTLNFEAGQIGSIPVIKPAGNLSKGYEESIAIEKSDWNAYETSWDFTSLPLLSPDYHQPTLQATYQTLRAHWREVTLEMQRLEEENNRIFIDAYGLQEELTPEVPLNEITLTCNPWYRYGKGSSQPSAISHQQNSAISHQQNEADAFTDGCKLTADGFPEDPELEARLQQDTMRELVSYAVGCMMGRYALEKPGLILADARASQSAHLQAHAEQVGPREAQRFPVDEDGILPLLDDEWFSDDVTARFTEFLRVTWGPESLSANLRLVEESLGKPIRKYLLTDFWKDHLQRYRKRPIYWLVQSPKRGFQALIYLHRYTHDTFHQVLNDYLREYLNKLRARQETLQLELASGGRASVQKELNRLEARLHELESWEREVLLPLAQQRLEIDLDDGVKVNYPKFGAVLASIPGL